MIQHRFIIMWNCHILSFSCCKVMRAVFTSILQHFNSITNFATSDINICADYNLGWSVQFLSFVWSYYLMGYFRSRLAKKTLLQLRCCIAYWTTSSTFSCLEFFFLTVIASSAMCSWALWAGQPRSRSKANRSFPKNFRRHLPFLAFQPSRLPWPWQWIRKWKWHFGVSSKFLTLLSSLNVQ